MKVSLINPPAQRIIEYGDEPEHPHLGLAYVAGALLNNENGFSPQVIDARYEGISLSVVMDRLKEFNPRIVGITAMTHMINDAHMVATRVKERNPETIIVIGGPHVTALPKLTLKEFPNFDIGIIGEGEITFPELIKSIEDTKYETNFSEIKGIVYRKAGKIIENRHREWIKNLDTLPFPAWYLFPRASWYPIMVQRGCPGRCNFCLRVLGDPIRHRSPENVIEELKMLVENYKIKKFSFVENFGLNRKKSEKILDLIIQQMPALKWKTSIRVDRMNEDFVKKMREAGCEEVGFGVESGDPIILKKTKKGTTIEKAIKASELAKKYGLKTVGFFIIGHPNETHKSVEKTIDLIVKMNCDLVAIGLMVPYPGTKIYDMATSGEGGYKLISSNWSDFNKHLGNSLELENLSRKQMERYQLIGYLKLYIYNLRFTDMIKTAYANRRLAFSLIKKIIHQ